MHMYNCVYFSSALASPEFEGRDGEELGAHLSQVISNVYSKGQCIDQSSLCVVPGRVCWNLYIDALVSVHSLKTLEL